MLRGTHEDRDREQGNIKVIELVKGSSKYIDKNRFKCKHTKFACTFSFHSKSKGEENIAYSK